MVEQDNTQTPPRALSTVLRKLKIRNQHARECLAEFLGTFVLLSFGDGSVAQSLLSKGSVGSALSIHWSWGIGVTMGIYVAGGVSGAHLNPAVTLAQACLGRLPWRKVPLYMLSQYFGAFVAGACVYLVYYDALDNFDGGTRQVDGDVGTAGIWATYPKPFVSTWNCFVDQIFGTGLLLLCILAVTDPKNAPPSRGILAISIGLTVVVIGMTFGFNCGYAINPARDLGPRIFTAIAGWGNSPFSYRNYNYFWVPIVGPYLGGIVGALVYQLCVGIHWPDDQEPSAASGDPAVKVTRHENDNREYDGPYNISESL